MFFCGDGFDEPRAAAEDKDVIHPGSGCRGDAGDGALAVTNFSCYNVGR